MSKYNFWHFCDFSFFDQPTENTTKLNVISKQFNTVLKMCFNGVSSV